MVQAGELLLGHLVHAVKQGPCCIWSVRGMLKLARHARHVLVELGDQALAPVGPELLPPLVAVALPEAA